MLRNTALVAGALLMAGFMAAPAKADLKLCNKAGPPKAGGPSPRRNACRF